MGSISRNALDVIRTYGFTRAQYVAAASADGIWYGDRCGCPDDRCIGHHHESEWDCSCLRATLDHVAYARALAHAVATDSTAAQLHKRVEIAEEEYWSFVRQTPTVVLDDDASALALQVQIRARSEAFRVVRAARDELEDRLRSCHFLVTPW